MPKDSFLLSFLFFLFQLGYWQLTVFHFSVFCSFLGACSYTIIFFQRNSLACLEPCALAEFQICRKLLPGKDRAVSAHHFIAHDAGAADPKATLHIPFNRRF